MREHNTFGISCRAGGIDDRGHIIDVDGPQPFVELILTGICAAFFHDLFQRDDTIYRGREFVKNDDLSQIRQL